MLCLTGSPPLTALSVITYLNPRLGLEQNPFQDLLNDRPQGPGSRPTLQGDPGDLPNCRIGEHQVRSVKPDELPELLDQ